MFCPNCGKELGPQSIFCPGCGKRVPEDPMKQAPSATSKQPAPYPGAGAPGQPLEAAPTYAPKPPTYGGYSAQATGAPTYPGGYQAGQQAGRYNPLGAVSYTHLRKLFCPAGLHPKRDRAAAPAPGAGVKRAGLSP